MKNLAVEIDRLETEGVRFSIAICGDGYVARVGDYLKGPAPTQHVHTVEEAIQWIATVSFVPVSRNWSN